MFNIRKKLVIYRAKLINNKKILIKSILLLIFNRNSKNKYWGKLELRILKIFNLCLMKRRFKLMIMKKKLMKLKTKMKIMLKT